MTLFCTTEFGVPSYDFACGVLDETGVRRPPPMMSMVAGLRWSHLLSDFLNVVCTVCGYLWDSRQKTWKLRCRKGGPEH